MHNVFPLSKQTIPDVRLEFSRWWSLW